MKTGFRYLYFLIVFICGTVNLTGQSIQEKADSIQLLIKNTAEDTAKSKHYVTLGALYVYNQPAKALSLLHKALTFLGVPIPSELQNAQIQQQSSAFPGQQCARLWKN